VHPVRRCDRIAFAHPPFAAHVDARLAIAPDDDNGETRQALRQSHVVDEALRRSRRFGILRLQSGYGTTGEQKPRYESKHSNTVNHHALRPTRRRGPQFVSPAA
jgi:hypothetical protein